nr:BMP family ABC transporter substrate-binding protein [Pyrodictium delaneyi]
METRTLLAAVAILVIIAGVAAFTLMRGGEQAAPVAEKTATTPETTATPAKEATATTTTAPAGQKLERNKICVVYDVGGRGDLSFNDMAYLGASKASKDFGLEVVEVQSTSESDYLPNLRTLAKDGKCAVIVAVGFTDD